jgi:hypothetical protein
MGCDFLVKKGTFMRRPVFRLKFKWFSTGARYICIRDTIYKGIHLYTLVGEQNVWYGKQIRYTNHVEILRSHFLKHRAVFL